MFELNFMLLEIANLFYKVSFVFLLEFPAFIY